MSEWWRSAVIYQVYVRSFADTNGDGIGDLPGIRSRLPYLSDLGVDGLWLTPFYPSPGADHGYDVSDYTDIDPQFGTVADFDELVEDAHELGLRVVIDIVPNHTSSEHPWFQNALSDPNHPTARATSSDWVATAARRTTGRRRSAAPRGRSTSEAASTTCTSSPRSGPTSTGTTRRCSRTSKASSASGSTPASTASGSTSRRRSSRRKTCTTWKSQSRVRGTQTG